MSCLSSLSILQKLSFHQLESLLNAALCLTKIPRMPRKPQLDMASPPPPEPKDTDFIKENALAAMHVHLSCKQSDTTARSVDKPDYGKVPEYLKATKLKLKQDKMAKEEEQRIIMQQVAPSGCVMMHKSKIQLL